MSLLWVLNLADGEHSLLSIAERSGLPFKEVAAAANLLADHGLLREAG
jgi:aminopeptidase-like protein